MNQPIKRMEIIIDTETIGYLFEALQTAPRRHPRSAWAEKEFHEAVNRGYVLWSSVEDMLIAMDSRLDSGHFRVSNLYEPLEIRFEQVHFRPRAISSGVMTFDALRPEYFVQLLIHLERMGFQIDAQRYVEIMLPTILPRSKKIFNSAELEIFWYKRTRLKQADIIFYTEKDKLYQEYSEPVKLKSGFKLSLGKEQEPQPYSLRIRAPKYRERPRLTEITCPKCGYEWQKGDPESSMLHRKEHKKRMSWLQPQPLTQMLNELGEKGLDAELVTCHSPEWKHNEMYTRALAFKREFHYDFVQWKSREGIEDPDVHGYLFTGEKGEIVGAGAFRNRSEDETPKWGLQWIWFCPQERRKGHLAKRWAGFRKQFGDFVVESPVSDAMQEFLRKQGDIALMNYNR
jgi:hypothetical protein